jgi:cytochrome c oxidase subunit 2
MFAPARKSTGRRIAVPFVLVLTAFALGGCELPTFGGFRGATTQAKTESTLWSQMVILGIGVAMIVLVLILWSAFRYRRRDERMPRQFSENIPLEIIYTVIPCILVGIIFWATVVGENSIDAVSSHPAEIVNVTAYRWGWRFSYNSSTGVSQNVLVQTSSEPKVFPQSALSSLYPQMVIPAHSTIRIVLQSVDVIHGFYIPAFNFSRYAQPGVINTFDFTTTSTGKFKGQCSQYCGLYHSEMLFGVRVVPQATFSQWLASHKS